MIRFLPILFSGRRAGIPVCAAAPIQDAGTYLPLILGAVFTWSSTKALLAERDHELHDNAASAHSAA